MRKSLKETAGSFTELLILELKRQSNQLSLSLTRSLNYFFFLFLFFFFFVFKFYLGGRRAPNPFSFNYGGFDGDIASDKSFT